MSDSIHPVVDLIRWSEGIHELVLERQGVSFTVGDCVALYDAGGLESRPYSLAGGLQENVLRIVFRAIPGGCVTSHLASLQPGDPVTMSAPFGWFRPGQDDDEAPCTFIATSTGIAPFLSYLRSFPTRPPRQILYGVREAADAVAMKTLTAATSVRLAVSRERAAPHHFGRVTDLLAELKPQPDEHFYLCGLDAMIDEVGLWLEERGVPFTHIHQEVFFHAETPST